MPAIRQKTIEKSFQLLDENFFMTRDYESSYDAYHLYNKEKNRVGIMDVLKFLEERIYKPMDIVMDWYRGKIRNGNYIDEDSLYETED